VLIVDRPRSQRSVLRGIALNRAGKLLGPLVNLASMAHIVQIDAAQLEVEFVKDSVIANSQLEFGSAFKSLVRETS